MEYVLKIVGIIVASIVSYKLATKEEGPLRETHPVLAMSLELIALGIIFG